MKVRTNIQDLNHGFYSSHHIILDISIMFYPVGIILYWGLSCHIRFLVYRFQLSFIVYLVHHVFAFKLGFPYLVKIVYNATSETNLEFYFHLIINYNIKDRYHQKTLFILVIKHNIKDRYHQKTFKFIFGPSQCKTHSCILKKNFYI